MSTTTEWALLYELDGQRPREFFEVGRVGASLWTCRGAVSTLGECDVVELGSVKHAAEEFARIVDVRRGEGFSLARSGSCDPRFIDFDSLAEEVAAGARRAFSEVRDTHPDEHVDGYALYSDADAMTIVCVADSAEHRRSTHGDDEHFRWNAQEWSYHEGGEWLDPAYRRILLLHQDTLHEEVAIAPPEGFEEKVFDACIRALMLLDRDGFFGSGADRESVFVTFEAGPGEDPSDAIRRLNPPTTYERFSAWRRDG